MTTLNVINARINVLANLSNNSDVLTAIDNAVAKLPLHQLDASVIIDALIDNGISSMSDVRKTYNLSLKTPKDLKRNDSAEPLRKELDVLEIKLNTLLEFINPKDSVIKELNKTIEQQKTKIAEAALNSLDTASLKKAKQFINNYAYLFLSELPASEVQRYDTLCVNAFANSKDYTANQIEMFNELHTFIKAYKINA